MLIPETDRIESATKEAKQGGCQLVDLIAWGTQGWERVAELEGFLVFILNYSNDPGVIAEANRLRKR